VTPEKGYISANKTHAMLSGNHISKAVEENEGILIDASKSTSTR